MQKWAVFVFFLVSGCLGPRVQTIPISRGEGGVPPSWLFAALGPQEKVETARYLGKFKITYYWVVDEKDYPRTRTTPLYTQDGRLLGKFSPAFVKDFKTESAARLRDGRCISYLKRQDRVVVVDKFLGYGGYKLTELKSIAVDPELIPLGSKVYIPQAEGVLVAGKRLNGIFYANDIGSAVKGRHIDIFLGKKEHIAQFCSVGMKSSSVVDVYILE